MNGLGIMLRYLKPRKGLLLLYVLCVLVEVSYASASPLSLKYLVDKAFLPKDWEAFWIIVGIVLIGGVLNIFAGMAGDYSTARLGGEAIRQYRTDLFQHIQRQSMPFYQKYRVGDLTTRFSADMSAVERMISGIYPFLFRESINVIISLVLLFSLEWRLTLAVLAGALLMIAAPKLVQRRAETANVHYKEAQERFSNTIDEMAKGHKTIINLHQQRRFHERAEEQIRGLFSLGLAMRMANSLMERLPASALLVLNGTMIVFGGYLIFHDRMTIGDFTAFLTLFISVGAAATNLTQLIPVAIDANVSFRRIGELLAEKPSVEEASAPLELPKAAGSVLMKDVTFGYTLESRQLRGVNLSIEAGSYVAFVGTSGSGKSTALQLLARFYDPAIGTVSVGGIDLRRVSEASLRRHASMVAQDTFLFNATIRDNLLLDNENASDERMAEAAKLAQIHSAVEGWPEGYDTMVHQEGASLSGGERQRLAIARALLRDPKLLLLDEATSALDPSSESEINGVIESLRGDRTIVSVTHRLGSAANADRIFVFDKGEIVESGSHSELLKLGGAYRGLWEKQQGFRVSPDGLHATVDAERLAKLAFFEGIDPELLSGIADLFATYPCQAGEAVVKQGEEGHQFYIIARGKFEVLKREPGQEEKRIAVLQDGDYFGEIALLKNIPRTATVKSIEPSILLSIRREAFQRMTREHPQVSASLEAALLDRM
ncbi:ABC transporter transmembrane domain-containing protein [Cohnella thailandensis]|uniref:ATP-binding cassette domain-containing protein n=1 Tax=Cohnella thailandensis TaxID=557557 RepID=A0A841T2E5_9BACL|nr:ABC transporter transmembrane domain-containing protein [Cohnella thailandensis]MBB6635261.1 ATP-binding cassette domain-containing protein [Cohnella thailandensis]MBP1974634.1 ATP-binding cassette subfamily B protein [Cohnella thailandensis]